MNSGSNYSSSVGEVGSTNVDAMYSTTTSSRTVGARKGLADGEGGMKDPGDSQSGESPIGEPLVMLLFAAAAGVVIAIRRRRAA